MAPENPFLVERHGHVAHLVFDRAQARNTMTKAFFDGIIEHFAAFDSDPSVRAIIVRAEGKSFTAGLDLVEAAGMFASPTPQDREGLKKHVMHLQTAMSALETCSKPVIAAIHGHCIGGGIDLVTAADIRIASADAVFSIRETRIAIVADMGTLQRLPGIIGPAWARELALTGRDFTAGEALKMGLVTHVLPGREELYAKAAAIAQEIADNSPLTVRGVKDVLNYSRDHGVWAGMEYVAQKNAALLPNDDILEALQAFREKRPPRFKD